MVGIPRVLGGRYELGTHIGRGGMADVYAGKDTRINRAVAIKILREDFASDPVFQARFRREAQSAGGLNHPAIVAVYDTGEEPVTLSTGAKANLPYIVMEFVEGRTVRALLSEGAALQINEAVQITLGVIDALEYSHAKGIVHRDIKPGNVMLTNTGDTKVMDFGIARAVADAQSTMTQTNSVVGTAQYLSPEQARGEHVDTRSDLYSTGCLIYELLTGRPPFKGDNATSIAVQHVQKLPTPPSKVAGDIPENIDRIVMKSLAKDRDKRYQDAASFRDDLRAAMRGLAVVAPPVESWIRSSQIQNQTRRSQNQTNTIALSPGAINRSDPPTEAFASSVGQPQSQGYQGRNFPTQTQPAIPVRNPAYEQHSRAGIWIWILTLLLVAGLVFIGISLINRQGTPSDPVSPTVETVRVPVLTGLDENGVRTALSNSELLFVKGADLPSDTVKKGLFIESEPKIGEEVKPGTRVSVVFSSGSATVAVPDLKQYTQTDARRFLEQIGIKVGDVNTVNEPGAEPGKVIRTEPASGETVNTDTPVKLFVASGQLQVPSVVNMTREKATKAIQDAGILPEVVLSPSDVAPPGTVISQNPSASLVSAGTPVQITVAEAPSVRPSTPPIPKPNVEPTTKPTESFTDSGNNSNSEN